MLNEYVMNNIKVNYRNSLRIQNDMFTKKNIKELKLVTKRQLIYNLNATNINCQKAAFRCI